MRRPPLILSLMLLATSAQADPPPSPKIIERYKQMLTANPVEGTALDRLWKIYADQGQTGQLLDEYKSADTFPAQMILGHLLHRAGRIDEAAAAYQSAAKLDATSALPALALAHLESDRGKHRDAAAWLEKAVALLPADDVRLPDALLQLGSAWLDAGEPDKAAQAWERTVALNPADLGLRRKLAEAYERNYLPTRAVDHLTYVEEHSPPTERPLLWQEIARIQQGAGQRDEAIAALEKALALTGPGNWLRAELESQLIRLHQRYHRTAELEDQWKKYAAENPRDLGGCLQLVELYERLGDLEQQRVWLTKLTALAPKNAEYRTKLARLLVQMDQPDQAVAVYDALLKEQPANADLVFERAELDLQHDDAPAAKRRIDALLATRKGDESVRAKALEFYQQARIYDYVEEHLTEDAAANGDDALVALAGFYFAQHRDGDARGVLQRLIQPSAPPPAAAAAHFRVAQILRAQNDLEDAVTELQAATSAQPDNRGYHLALGELQAMRGQYPLAQEEFESAIRGSANDTERTEAEQKLFDSFRSAAASGQEVQPLPPGFTASGPESGAPPNPALDLYFASLEKDAREQGTEAAWLRLARWRMWNRDGNGAAAAAQRALDLNPKSIAAYELLVKLQTATGPSPAAVQDLGELARLDPANRASYERRAGQLELQAGNVPEALAIFERLVQESPGDLEALGDLALTQQRAEHWPEALATWRQVYALSPTSRRRETTASLLRALDQLGQHQEAAEFQFKAIEAEPNERERFNLFGDLLADCVKNGQLEWLRAQFEKRRKLHADDYFTEVALGRILKASGQPSAAFEVLADASYAAPNQAEALPDLIREAEDLHKVDAAVKLQEQLLRIAPQETPDGWEKLAQLQEKNFDVDAAEQTWDRLVARFPRDATVLNRAVDFQLAWGTPERAIALLRRSRAADPTNIHTLSTLATFDLQAGETAEARECLETILRRTVPEKPGDPVKFPALKPTQAGRLQSAYLATVSQRGGTPTPDAMRALRSFWVDDAEETTAADVKSDREVRLTAIRQLAQIVATTGDAGARAGWAERWRKATEAPSESLWALFYAGDGAATLDRVDTMMRESPRDSRIAQAFIWLALQTHQYDRLGTWLKDPHRTPSERDSVFIALGEELDATTGKIDPGLLKALFAEGTHLRPWQGAMLFAGRNRYREAITLARGVFDSAPAQRAALAQELANWHLLLGEPGPAREILRTTISSVADSLEAPVCAALCDYYRLLPEPDRPGFVESYLSGIDPQRQPLHAALAGAVLHGLAGNEGAAHADLDRLVDMRALTGQFEEGTNSGSRHLQFVLAIGAQLEAMKLEDLAIYFWERALADQALVQLQGDQAANLAHDIRLRLCVLRAATVPPGDLPQWLDLYERLSPTEGLAPLANALATIGAQARAVAIFRQVWERDPGDLEALRNLLSACRAAGDNGTAEAALRVVLSDGGSRLPDGARRDFLLEFADVLERESDLDGARVALSNAVENTPNDTRLLLRLGQLHERAGQPMEAINTYQRLLVMEPGNLAARLALSVLYENQNRLNDALALFQSGAGPDFDARLAVLQARNNQPEAALTTLDRILPPQHVTPALNLAAAFVARNDRAHARAAVQSALQRTEDPRLCFPLQCKVVELLVPEDKPVVARRELQRLRRFAINGGNPGLLASYLDFASTQAARLGVQKDFLTEARALWAEGSGPIPAGIALLTAQYDETEKTGAAATLTQLLARDDATDSWLQNAADYLEKTGHGEELARVQERICQVNPLNEQNFVNLAHTLKLLGRIDDARARLELLAARAMLNEDSLGKVAQAFLDLGDRPRAQALYVAAVGSDRFARNWEVWLEYARMQTAARDFANARRTLRTAYGVPANSDYTGIIEWLVAANRLHDADEATADFGLSPSRQDDFHAALFSYFEKAGQPANALAVAETHPTFVHPSFAVRLRKLAVSAHDFDRGARLLEKLAAQASAPEEFSLELARLHGDWAQTLLEAGDQEGTLANLRVAHEAHPELFEITLRFSALQQQRGDHKGAIETLQSFLAVAKAPAEIEQARAQLAKLRSGG